MDWFKNKESITKFLGACEGLPYGYHKASFAIDLDKITYFREESSSSSPENPNEDENTNKDTLEDLSIDQERLTLLVEKTKEVNIGDAKIVHKIYLVESLKPKDRDKFIHYLSNDQ